MIEFIHQAKSTTATGWGLKALGHPVACMSHTLSLIKHFSCSLRIIGRPDTEVKGEDMASVVPKEQRTMSQKATVS